jgi:hypothetical protein
VLLLLLLVDGPSLEVLLLLLLQLLLQLLLLLLLLAPLGPEAVELGSASAALTTSAAAYSAVCASW